MHLQPGLRCQRTGSKPVSGIRLNSSRTLCSTIAVSCHLKQRAWRERFFGALHVREHRRVAASTELEAW